MLTSSMLGSCDSYAHTSWCLEPFSVSKGEDFCWAVLWFFGAVPCARTVRLPYGKPGLAWPSHPNTRLALAIGLRWGGLSLFLVITTSSLSGFCAAVESYWALAWPCGTLRGPMSDAAAGRGADLAARSARAAEPIIVASAQSIKRTHGLHTVCSAFQDAYLWMHCTYLHRKYLQQQ